MIAFDLYRFLQANLSYTDNICPHVAPAENTDRIVLWSQEESIPSYTHEGDDNCLETIFRLVYIAKEMKTAMEGAEEAEALLRDFEGELVTGQSMVDRTIFLNEYTFFDTQIERFGVVQEIQFTHSR